MAPLVIVLQQPPPKKKKKNKTKKQTYSRPLDDSLDRLGGALGASGPIDMASFFGGRLSPTPFGMGGLDPNAASQMLTPARVSGTTQPENPSPKP